MEWISAIKEPLMELDLPDQWCVQFGSSEAYQIIKGKWESADPMEIPGRLLDGEEVKVAPKIGNLSVVVYFIPRTTLTVVDKPGTKMSRHITVTMRPYYRAKSDEDAVGKFWKEYGGVVGLLESLDYELRNQDVDYLDDGAEYNYFVDTEFWKFLRSSSQDEVVLEILRLVGELRQGRFLDEG